MPKNDNSSLTVLRSAYARKMQRQENNERLKLVPLVDEIAAQVADKVIAQLKIAGFVPATIETTAKEITGPIQDATATPKKGGKTKEDANA